MFVKIYVPTERSDYLKALAKIFSEQFGGCTMIPNCKGFWFNGKKQLIEDKITIIESYITQTNLEEKEIKQILEKIALDVKRDLKQDCVAFIINEKIYFR